MNSTLDASIFNNIDSYLSSYIMAFDKTLIEVHQRIPDRARQGVLHAAWVTISQNAIMFLRSYRKNLDPSLGTIIPTPIYELAFYDRIIIETSSDFKYIFPDKKLSARFIYEFDDIVNHKNDTIAELSDMNYNAHYRFKHPTTERVRLCYGDNGVAHYNVLCWSTHFNYIGYVLAISGKLNVEIRSKGLIFILEALNTIYSVLDTEGLIKYSDPVVPFRQKSEYYLHTIKDVIKEYIGSITIRTSRTME